MENTCIYKLWDAKASDGDTNDDSESFEDYEGFRDSRGLLNESQRHAIDCALNNVFEVIQGPPG